MDNAFSIDELLHRNHSLEKQIVELKSAEKLNYTLFDISNAVNMTRNLEELYQAIYNSLNKLIPLPNFFIARYDNHNKTISFEFFVDEYDDDFPIIENLQNPNSLTGEVILSKRPLLFKENMLLEKIKQNRLMGTIPKIWLGVPLIIRDTVIGVICVQSYTDPDYFSHKHLEMLVSVSEQIAIAIERKQIIDALEKKKRTLSLISDNTSSIVIIIDSNGNYEFTNPAHHKMGYSPDDLKNLSFFDLVHPDEIQKLMNFLEKGLGGSTSHITLDFRFLDKFDQYHNLEGTFDIIRNQDGFIEKIIFIGEDISEEKKTQKALLESQERFSLIFDTNPDSIIITDIESGTIVDANIAFLSLSGFSKNNIIGKTTNKIGIWKNDKQRDTYISKLKQNGYYKNLEVKLVLKNRTVAALVSSRLLQLNDATHVISIIRDISDRKNLEKQRQKRQKMDSITILAGGIAHDFNKLLSSIIGYLDLLNLDSEMLSDTHRANVTNALISSKRAAKLIRRLQALTKSDSGTLSRFDIYKVITDVLNIIATKHEGMIDIETKPGIGTTFHLYGPSARKPTSNERRSVVEKNDTQTVLVIDDEDMVRDMAVKALKSFGYRTLEACDGEMGLDVFKKNRRSIDAILLDVIMPKMSGTETFKQMLKVDPDVKVIIASGHITNMDQKKMFTKASAYLDKPYQIIELKQALQSILN